LAYNDPGRLVVNILVTVPVIYRSLGVDDDDYRGTVQSREVQGYNDINIRYYGILR